MTVSTAHFNIQATALIAAIGVNKGIIHYQCFKRAIDGYDFMEFLRGLKRAHGKKRRSPLYG